MSETGINFKKLAPKCALFEGEKIIKTEYNILPWGNEIKQFCNKFHL